MSTEAPVGKKRGPKKRVKIGQYDVVSCPECYDPSAGKPGIVRVVRSIPEPNPFERVPTKWRMIQYRKCLKCGYTWITWYEFDKTAR